MVCSALCCAALRCAALAGDPMLSAAQGQQRQYYAEMIEAHAARSFEEGSACARTPVAGPGVTRKMDVGVDAVHARLKFRNHRDLISGRQSGRGRYRSLPRLSSQTEYISLYWKPASRLKSCCESSRVMRTHRNSCTPLNRQSFHEQIMGF